MTKLISDLDMAAALWDPVEDRSIPKVYLVNYLYALNALLRTINSDPPIRVLDLAWRGRCLADVPWKTLDSTQTVLDGRKALLDARDSGKRGLPLPASADV